MEKHTQIELSCNTELLAGELLKPPKVNNSMFCFYSKNSQIRQRITQTRTSL